TGLEAKFSLRFCAALAATGRDTSDLRTFTDAAAAEPSLVALRDKVTVELVPGWPPMKAEVVIDLADGERLETGLDAGVPNRDLATQGRRLRDKFSALTTPVLGARRSAELLSALDRLDDIRIGDLVELCKPE